MIGEIFRRRTFFLLTGASRGLGKCICLNFAEKFSNDSLFLLIARDESSLKEIKEQLRKSQPSLRVSIAIIDLQEPNPEVFLDVIRSCLDDFNAKAEDFEQAVIVHNAGSLGNISVKTTEMENLEEFRQYFDLNLSSAVCLNTQFLRVFPSKVVKHRFVINISSLAAFHPFKSWGFYCTGKAAREMFFRVMAAEDTSLRVLNYAPGPLKTDMTIKAREETADPELRQWFIDAYDEGKMLAVEFTVNRLIAILEKDQFKSGDHVDVFDDMERRTSIVSD